MLFKYSIVHTIQQKEEQKKALLFYFFNAMFIHTVFLERRPRVSLLL